MCCCCLFAVHPDASVAAGSSSSSVSHHGCCAGLLLLVLLLPLPPPLLLLLCGAAMAAALEGGPPRSGAPPHSGDASVDNRVKGDEVGPRDEAGDTVKASLAFDNRNKHRNESKRAFTYTSIYPPPRLLRPWGLLDWRNCVTEAFSSSSHSALHVLPMGLRLVRDVH